MDSEPYLSFSISQVMHSYCGTCSHVSLGTVQYIGIEALHYNLSICENSSLTSGVYVSGARVHVLWSCSLSCCLKIYLPEVRVFHRMRAYYLTFLSLSVCNIILYIQYIF